MFSKKSRERLETCDPRLIKVMELAIQRIDFSVSCGHRGEAEQDAAVRDGHSKTPWPRSKHNAKPSRAVDIFPYPFKNEYWKQPQVWADQAKVVLDCAAELGIRLRWGGDWNQDGNSKDERFYDGPHFELLRSKYP